MVMPSGRNLTGSTSESNPNSLALNPAAFAAAVGSSKSTTIRVKGDRKRQRSSGITKRKDYSARACEENHKVNGNTLRITTKVDRGIGAQ